MYHCQCVSPHVSNPNLRVHRAAFFHPDNGQIDTHFLQIGNAIAGQLEC